MKYQGLSPKTAKARLKQYGPNRIAKKRSFSFVKQFWDVVKEPTFSLLIGIAILYAIIGELKEVFILLFAIIPIGGIQLFQNIKVDRTLQELRQLMDHTVKVIRNGEERHVPSSKIVPGDVVYVTAGDKVPADGVVRSKQAPRVDESLLTGESRPVQKQQFAGDIGSYREQEKLDTDNQSLVFGGSFVVEGEGFVEILKTGRDTKYGEIGELVQTIEEGDNRLQRELQMLVRRLFMFSFVLTFAMFVVVFFDTGANLGLLAEGQFVAFFASGDVVEALLLALTMAIASIPEELPVVFSVFLIIGARRIAAQNALVRNMTSIESLGSANVICVDKTGTLTEGSLSVSHVYHDGTVIERGEEPQTESFQSFLKNTILAGERYSADPIEKANKEYVKEYGLDPEVIYEEYPIFADFAFDQKKKLISHVYSVGEEDELQVFVGGAPEQVLKFCTLTEERRVKLREEYRELSGHGYRVVGYARRTIAQNEVDPEDRNSVEYDLEFVGFVAMSDPIREAVPQAVKTAYQAGMRLIMITGDGPDIARSIGEEVGIDGHQEVLTGRDLPNMSDDALRKKLGGVNMFARILPEQKYRLVRLLQERGNSVGMTGDGVNDAPAIKSADVGIAMGDRGTEVAREAADIILLDDNFATIVSTIRNGRRIYDNLKKSLGYLILIHLAMFALAFFVPLLGLPVLLFPIHIIALELILDPLAVLGFENEPPRSDLMKRPPRSQKEHFLSFHNIRPFVIYGLFLTVMAFTWYVGILRLSFAEEVARTVAFSAIVIGQLVIVLFTRNGKIKERVNLMTNKLMAILFGLTLGLLLIAISVPSVADVFKFSALPGVLFIFMVVISGGASAMVTLLVHDVIGFTQKANT